MWKHKKQIMRIVAWLLILGMVAAFLINIAFAEQAIPSTPPQNITVTDIAYADEDGQNWFASFSWAAPYFPPQATEDRSQNFFFNRVERGTGYLSSDVLQFTLNSTDTSLVTRGYGIELDHGKIYEFYGRSSYIWGEFEEFSYESGRSNKVKFLTDVEFGAALISGTNEIKIVWDDVWDTSGRINYRILVSDTSGFTQPPSIPDIIGTDIGTEDSRVTVNGERLEYIYANAMPGREYSIKVIPLVGSNVSKIPDEEIPIVKVKTEILLRAKKMGETADGVRWMLFWDPIIKGAIGSTTFTRVEYKLYRYDSVGVETFFALVTDKDRYEMNLKPGDVDRYKYKIEAVAYKPDGGTVPFYSTTQVSLKEQIPEYPSSPEFVNSFPNSSPAPLVYDDLLTSSSATLLWRIPQTGDGKLDTEVYYDLYLVENLEDMSTLPITKRIGANLTMSADQEVRELETGKLIGYKYPIKQLRSNSIYYVVMIAKKNFLAESDDGSFMVSRPYLSEPAIKVIITRPATDTEKPLTPPSPPFRLKPGVAVSKNGFTLQMEKTWTEMFHAEMNKWLYVVREDDPESGQDNSLYSEANSFSHEQYLQNNSLADGDPAKKPVRIIKYNAGWEVLIHCVDYSDALRTVKELKGREYVTYSDLKQGYILSMQKKIPPVTVPALKEDNPQVFSMPVTAMEPNKTYLVWITVKNSPGQLESEPSDPILVTTQPDSPSTVEIPVVPTDLKGIPTDNYVDLFWTPRKNYTYNIIYGTTEDRTKATGKMTITAAQLGNQPWARVPGLQADTAHYFWIQAASPGNVLSQWSNALIVKTEERSKPPRPQGFGIKDAPDAVGQNHVIYEWVLDQTVTYILEISENADFSESVEYQTDGSEFQVTELKSNYRYFARLYAYRSDTGLRSEPAAVIMVVTRKGRGEYDADVPLEDIPVGELVVTDAIAVKGIWNTKVLGRNAHLLSEKLRQTAYGAFSIELASPPPGTSTIRIDLAGVVLESLTGMQKNLLIKTPGFEVSLSPGSLLGDTYFYLKRSLGDIAIRVDIKTPVQGPVPETRWQYARPAADLQVLAGNGNSFMPVGEFTRPIIVSLPVENQDGERLRPRLFDHETGKWAELAGNWMAGEAKMMAYPQSSGIVAVLQPKSEHFEDIAGTATDVTVQNLLSLYAMPSLPSGAINPGRKLTISEGMKHLLDIIPYEYGNEDVVRTSQRAGMLLASKNTDASTPLRRDAAVYAAVSLLGKKTAQRLTGDIRVLSQIEDYDSIQTEYRQACAFAVANGMIEGRGRFNPDTTITRSELLSLAEMVLQLAGEL
ncbi:MAG: fibronectin type III domain-containing protein [Thermoclostridium sp.]|nr:fibronectin type III domain-containing protein [Thermoclostridium sp.]